MLLSLIGIIMEKINELAIIGDALKEERRLLGMTQEQIAQQFKISLKSLRNLEQGYGGVPLATVAKILEYMGKQLRVGDIVSSPSQTSKSRPRKKQILETLELVKPVLIKKFSVEKIALFGSCARDNATKKSDIDIAIKFSKSPTFSSLGKLTLFLETLFDGRKIDLVEFDKMIPEVATKAKSDFTYV